MKHTAFNIALLFWCVVLGCFLIIPGCGNNDKKPKSKIITEINPKSSVTTPWSLQPRWIDTSEEKLHEIPGGIKDVLPIVKGSITSVENIFKFDMSKSYDPLEREIEYKWVVNNIAQDYGGKVFIVELSKDANHTVQLMAIVQGGNEELSYSLASGFIETFELRLVFSKVF